MSLYSSSKVGAYQAPTPLVSKPQTQSETSDSSSSFKSRLDAVIARVSQDLRNTFDTLFPRNPLTLRRQFIRLPLKLEFLLGRAVEFSDRSHEMSSYKEGELEEKTRKVFSAIQNILPCYAGMSWPASLRFCDKSVDNAYCAPGCRVTVYTGIEKTIEAHLAHMKKTGQSTVDVKTAEGKTLSIDVSDVNYEDVVAALIGHELTHGVARHGSVRLAFGAILGAFLSIASPLLRSIAKICFSETVVVNQDPHNGKRAASPKEAQKQDQSVKVTEHRFTPAGHLLNGLAFITDFEFARDLIRSSVTLANSRTNEYEADKLGMVLADKAGFNAKGALVLMQILGKGSPDPQNRVVRAMLNAVLTHPLSSDRMRANHQTLQEIELMKQRALATAAAAA